MQHGKLILIFLLYHHRKVELTLFFHRERYISRGKSGEKGNNHALSHEYFVEIFVRKKLQGSRLSIFAAKI